MSLRKQKNEVNRTRMRLANWLDRHKDGPSHYSQMLHPMLEDIASGLNIPVNDVSEALCVQPLSIQMNAFVYEECVLRPWADADQRPIDDFIAKQLRRERPIGSKFIAKLAQSSMRVWQIVDIHPGKWVAVMPLRDKPRQDDKIRHVYDEMASQTATKSDYLLGRVMPMPEGRIFSASLLPLNRPQAGSLVGASASSIVHDGFVTWGLGALSMFSNSNYGGNESFSSPLPKTATGERSNTPNTSVSDHSSVAGTTPPHDKNTTDNRSANQNSQDHKSSSTEHSTEHSNRHADAKSASSPDAAQPPDREKLLERIRKLFAMSQETEASPHEAEIALRRCQSLMSRYGITEADLHTSKFSTETFRTSNRVPMHVQWLASAMQSLHSVLFVTGGGEGPEFRGFDIDVKVARMTMEYLEDAIERSLTTRRRAGTFPAGRSAAYDYRVSFAIEVSNRIDTLVEEREAAEAAATVTGTSLTIRKMEIVDQECGQDLRTSRSRFFGARPGEAAEAGRADGAKVSLDPQVDSSQTSLLG